MKSKKKHPYRRSTLGVLDLCNLREKKTHVTFNKKMWPYQVRTRLNASPPLLLLSEKCVSTWATFVKHIMNKQRNEAMGKSKTVT